MRGLDSSEPEVTRVMIAAGISQLPRQDWDLATAGIGRGYEGRADVGASVQRDDAPSSIAGARSFGPACAKDLRRSAQQFMCHHGALTTF